MEGQKRAAEYQLEITTHGRYLVQPPDDRQPGPLLVGFHGYAESAETQLDRMAAIPGAERWWLVSVQGLHRFYRSRTNQVVANWMTKQDRELAIADNIAYVAATLTVVSGNWPIQPRLVFAGFSQGVAMAFRAAAHAGRPAAVIAVGADVPPELGAATLRNITDVLICRGTLDPMYHADQFAHDVVRLHDSGVQVRRLEFDGAHEWSSAVIEAATAFLEHLG